MTDAQPHKITTFEVPGVENLLKTLSNKEKIHAFHFQQCFLLY